MGICRTIYASFIGLLVIGLSVAFVPEADADGIERLVADLDSGSPEVRMAAVERLGTIKSDESVQALIGVVRDRGDDWRLQIRAIRKLGSTDNPAFVELLIDMLNDPFVTNTCPALKWNAALALGSFARYPKVFDALVYSLHDKDIYVREAVIQSLGRLGDARAVPFLAEALHDKSFAIQYSAVKALGILKDSGAAGYLRRIARNSDDPLLRSEARSFLGDDL